MTRNCVASGLLTLTTALAFAPAFGQDGTPAPPSVEERVTAEPHSLLSRTRLLGIDSNSDGIRDDVAALVDGESIASTDGDAASAVRKEIAAAARRAPAPPPRSSRCMSYLLLDPEDQAAANLYMQGRTHGVFGTNPCDPFVSPQLERPYDTDFAQIRLGPVVLDYADFD